MDQTGPLDELSPELYQQLRNLAEAHLAREQPGLSLQASDLVHEAYLRLKDGNGCWKSRAHFFNTVAETMQRILVDAARRRQSLKRGGAFKRLPLRDERIETPTDPDLILSIDEALQTLQGIDARAAEIIRLHFFTGLSIDEVADALEMSRAHAYRQWHYARAWLYHALSPGE